jgi:hypothetical protein
LISSRSSAWRTRPAWEMTMLRTLEPDSPRPTGRSTRACRSARRTVRVLSPYLVETAVSRGILQCRRCPNRRRAPQPCDSPPLGARSGAKVRASGLRAATLSPSGASVS